MNKPDMAVPDPWTQHEQSQALYFNSLSLQEKMEAIEAMADLVRHFEKMRAEGKFRLRRPPQNIQTAKIAFCRAYPRRSTLVTLPVP